MTESRTAIQWMGALAALAWMGVIFYLSSQSVIQTPALFPGQDKVFHAGVFGLLGVFFMFALNDPRRHYHWKHVVIAAGGVLIYGISDEIHQYFVPGRSSDFFDILADFGGGLLATAGLARLLPESHQV